MNLSIFTKTVLAVEGGAGAGDQGVSLGTIKGSGPLGLFNLNQTTVFDLFNTVISNTIAVLTISASLWFMLQFILGAFGWLSAGGDKTAVENARKKITNAIVGLVIVVAAIFFIDLFGKLIGIDILSPDTFLGKMWP